MATALAGLLLVVAISPVAQTWFGEWLLARQPEWHGTLETFSVGWSRVEVTNLRMERGGAVLTVPLLRAEVPLWTLVRERKIVVRRLAAKGWTLDLTGEPRPAEAAVVVAAAPAEAPAASGAGRAAAGRFRGVLAGWSWPWAATVDAVELDGDILGALPPGHPPTRVHAVIHGGGIGAGREADLAVEVSALDLRLPGNSETVRGRLTAAVDPARRVERIGLKADISTGSDANTAASAWSLDLTAAREPEGEVYHAEVVRDGRALATVAAHWTAATGALGGSWKLAGRDEDVRPFVPRLALPRFTLAGEGRLETDAGFGRVHVAGRFESTGAQLGAFTPRLGGVGDTTLAGHFDVTREGRKVHVDQLDLSLGAGQPVASVRALRPFEFDERTGKVTASEAPGDWLGGSLRAFPLKWLSGLTDGFAFTAGEVTGDGFIASGPGGFAWRSTSPLVATGVAIERGGKPLVQNLDLSFTLSASRDQSGWQAAVAPLTIESGGRHLATIEAGATCPAGEKAATTLHGKWEADLVALAAQPRFAWLTARAASGDVTGTISSYADLLSHLTVVGHDPSRTLAATVRADLYSDGAAAVVAPVKIAFGPDVSEIKTDCNWSAGATANRVELNVSGGNVALDHLRRLAGPLMALGGGKPAVGPGAAREAAPFWGDWLGHVTLAFERLRTSDGDFVDVGGSFRLEHDAIRLDGGHAGRPKENLAQIEGSLGFAPDAQRPYTLQATASFSEFDATPLFAPERKSDEPVLEGRFSVAGNITGQGADLPDLIAHTREEYRFASKGGIIRLLRTEVAQALPPPPETKVGNALDSVGSAFGKLFGVKPDSVISADVKVAPTTQAVLDFRDAVLEIGYDSLTLTAVRGADRTIRLGEFVMTAADERLTGAGQIGAGDGGALWARPLSLDLQLQVRGRPAELLAKAGLLGAPKDAEGFAPLNGVVHFGGTLAHIDATAWRDLLVKAARPKPAEAAKAKGS